MDRRFLECATDTELRLEAEGLFLTAQAIRQVINAYVLDHTKYKTNLFDAKKLEAETDLTPR